MSKDLLSISIRMLKPRNDIEHSLSYENKPVIYTMPTIWSAMTLEVYETQYKQSDVGLIGYEWRLIEVEKTPTGTAKKVVKFDSYEGCYSNAAIALRDALLFCSINDL